MVSPIRSFGTSVRSLLLALLLLNSAALLAEPSIQLSTEQPQAGVPFSVIIEADSATESGPDLQPLQENFKILNSRTSQHIIIKNGQRSRSSQWVVTLVREHAGRVTIPPLSLGAVLTPALQIDVQPAPDIAALEATAAWLELELHPRSAFVQQQTKLVVKVMRRQGVDLDGATLSAPEFTGGDMVVEAIDKDKAYRIERDGQSLDVIERSYFLFPQSSGEIVLKPMELVGRVIEGAASLFDPIGTTFRSVRLTTQPYKLIVNPAPESGGVDPWLPAEELLLTETWSSEGKDFQVGAALTRTMGVLARGLTAAQLPDLTPQLPSGLRMYPEQPILNNQKEADGVVGSRTLKLTILASEPGEYEIPEVKLPWFNLSSGKVELATLPSRILRVTGLPNESNQAQTSSLQAGDGQSSPLDAPAQRALGALPDQALLPSLLLGAALGLGFGVLLGRYGRKGHLAARTPVFGTAREEREASQYAWRQAVTAARANRAEVCRRAIVLAAPRWLGPRVNPRSLAELVHALPDGPLASEIAKLAAALYAKEADVMAWNGQQLALALEQQPVYRPIAQDRKSSAIASLIGDG